MKSFLADLPVLSILTGATDASPVNEVQTVHKTVEFPQVRFLD